MTNEMAWIKTIEGLYLEVRGAEVDWKQLAADAGVTERTLHTRKKKLLQVGNELALSQDEYKKDGK